MYAFFCFPDIKRSRDSRGENKTKTNIQHHRSHCFSIRVKERGAEAWRLLPVTSSDFNMRAHGSLAKLITFTVSTTPLWLLVIRGVCLTPPPPLSVIITEKSAATGSCTVLCRPGTNIRNRFLLGPDPICNDANTTQSTTATLLWGWKSELQPLNKFEKHTITVLHGFMEDLILPEASNQTRGEILRIYKFTLAVKTFYRFNNRLKVHWQK